MTILLVCHSVGDTEVLAEVARCLLRRGIEEEICLFTVGQAAKRMLSALPAADTLLNPRVKVHHLSEVIGDEPMRAVENASLEGDLLERLQKYLDGIAISRVLVGAPSQFDAAVPYQIAEYLSPRVQAGAGISITYPFLAEAFFLWKALLPLKSEWFNHYIWFFPFLKAAAIAQRYCADLPIEVTGHPAVDKALESLPDPAKVAATRVDLEVVPGKILLFVSGSKLVKEDHTLVRELLLLLENRDDIELRLGLHPGMNDAQLVAYIDAMSILIAECAEKPIYRAIKITASSAIHERLASLAARGSAIDARYILSKSISGDDSATAAQGVASSALATLGMQRAAQGAPVYCHDESITPFVDSPPYPLFHGGRNIGLFVEYLTKSSAAGATARVPVAAERQSAIEIMADRLTGKLPDDSPVAAMARK